MRGVNLRVAHIIALQNGLRYVYTDNNPDPEVSVTYRPAGGEFVVEVVESQPGDWGSCRQPVFMGN